MREIIEERKDSKNREERERGEILENMAEGQNCIKLCPVVARLK